MYNKTQGIVNKPNFEVVYGRVRDFCTPFILGNIKADAQWCVDNNTGKAGWIYMI